MKDTKRIGLIYGAYCIVSKKWYIGKTDRTFKKRQSEHFYDAYKRISRNSYECMFYRAIRKYGKDKFKWFIIEENIPLPCHYENGKKVYDKTLLNDKERYWIKHYKSFGRGYNMTPGGDGGNGHDFVPVLQYDLDGNFIREFESISDAVYTTKTNKVFAACYGYMKRAGKYQWRLKESDNYPLTIESYNNPLNKAVLQYDLDGNFIREFSSLTEAENTINAYNINKSCKSINYTVAGYMWRYKESDNYPIKIEPYRKDIYRHILQYDLDGNFVKEWYSTREIEDSLNISVTVLSTVLFNKRKSCHGYIWIVKTTNDYPKHIEPYSIKSVPKQICQYKDGILVRKYESISEASRLMGIPRTTISACLCGRCKSAGGYGWAYAS